MTKEEILINNVCHECNNPGVHKSMDDFARQECIAFAEWMCKKGFDSKLIMSTSPSWEGLDKKHHSSEKLYNLYLLNQQKG